MGRQHFYKGNDPYKIDARTGFAVRASATRKEWTGQIVRERSWEPRQPQDFVRGTVDDQTVPEPRPRQPHQFIPICVTSLAGDAGIFDGIGDFAIGESQIGDPASIYVASTQGWLTGDVVWIMQNNGSYWRAEIVQLDGLLATISPPVVRTSSAGNLVLNISAAGRLAGSAYPGEIGDFGIGINEIGVTSLDEFGQAPEGYLNESTVPYGIR